jgi:hypothetical protein
MRILILAVILAAAVTPAKAWNCSNPLAARVDVGKTKPSGTAGDADGQYFLGTGSEGVKGDYYVCQVPKTAPKTKTPKSTLNQSQGQQQTANGGSSTLTNSGNSTSSSSASNSLANSGNSSNKNTNNNVNSANGGTANSNSSATNNGNGSNNASYQSTTTVEAAKIPVNSAFAPATIPTVDCYKTYSGGAQTSAFGISLGGGKIDTNCRKLQTAVHSPNKLVYCKVFITTIDAKEAGVTLQDCLAQDQSPAPVAPVTPAVQVTAPVPVAQAPVPVPTIPVRAPQQIGQFGISRGVLTNVAKRQLDDAARRLANDPTAVLQLSGPWQAAQAVGYLKTKGVSGDRILQNFSDDQNSTVSLELVWGTVN